MNKIMNYFPVSLASGKAFCNRKEELKQIHYNLENKIATLLVSPRRYGKTSLVLQALEHIKWPYAHIDLYKALSEDDIARFILNGVGRLLGQIERSPKKLMKVAAEFFAGFQLKFAIEKAGVSVEFSKKEKKPVDLILAALEKLDDYVVKSKKEAVLFMDEFQTIAEVVNNNSIEAAIREAAQKAKAVCYVFSGSNRHLIESMFNDRNRPFYNLCDQLTLNRIDSKHYIPYINKAAKAKWDQELPVSLIEIILSITDCHSYYVNKLCSIIWRNTQIPITEDIENAWAQYVDESTSRVEQELSLLTLNQRKLLLNLAISHVIKEPFGQECALLWGMSSTSIHRAMEALLVRDYVFVDQSGAYKILDPLFRSVLNS